MDRWTWWATVHEVAKGRVRLRWLNRHPLKSTGYSVAQRKPGGMYLQPCIYLTGCSMSLHGACMPHQALVSHCDPMDCSPPGASVRGILQAILEWVAMPPSRWSSRPRDRTHVSLVSCISRWVLYHYRHLGNWGGAQVAPSRTVLSSVDTVRQKCRAAFKMKAVPDTFLSDGETCRRRPRESFYNWTYVKVWIAVKRAKLFFTSHIFDKSNW